MIRNVVVVIPPTRFPLERDDALNMLKLDGSNPALTDEVLLVEDLIAAATDKCEKFTGRCFMTQTLKMILTPDIKPIITGGVMTYATENLGASVPLWRPPCQSVTSIKIVGEDAVEHTVPTGTYNVQVLQEPALIRLNFGAYWPIYLRGWYEIQYVAGYGDTIDKVPSRIRHAIRLTVAQWWAQRENLDYTLPTAAVDLLDDYVIDVGDM